MAIRHAMKRAIFKGDEHKSLFSKKMGCSKWFNNQSVTVLLRNVERMTTKSAVDDASETIRIKSFDLGINN